MDLMTLAKTVWGEARGEGFAGMTAVAWVIKNRAAKPSWWGDTVTSVCLKPSQFSCWNADDPNRPLMDTLSVDDDAYLVASGTAALVLAGVLPDPTGGATHYLRAEWIERVPWPKTMQETARIGHHVFFREPQP